jgi:hypothetical protein
MPTARDAVEASPISTSSGLVDSTEATRTSATAMTFVVAVEALFAVSLSGPARFSTDTALVMTLGPPLR